MAISSPSAPLALPPAAMARAQRLRWKKVKLAAEPKAQAAKPKRKRSAAVRKRMAVAQKKRWAAIKAASVSKTGVAKKSSAKTFA